MMPIARGEEDRSYGDAQETSGLPRVAFQGEAGAYGDQAIRQHWHGCAAAIPTLSFDEVVIDVARGAATYGVLPVWNTVVGDIESGRAAVRSAVSPPHNLILLGTEEVMVRHNLLVLPRTKLADVRTVASHPVALAQCARFLKTQPQMNPQVAYDTAGAARELALSAAPDAAAIAGSAAAERYGLSILCPDIQDVPVNITRFVILGRAGHEAAANSQSHDDPVSRW
jgi:prephenate dehydratase